MNRTHTIIGNPENRRVKYFVDALQQLGQPDAQVISYIDLLSGRQKDIKDTSFLRIESPGENAEVERLLIARGAELVQSRRANRTHLLQLHEDHGRIRYLPEWIAGFCDLLDDVGKHFKRSTYYNEPAAIKTMFDKNECHRIFQKEKITKPELLGKLANYQQLVELLHETGCRQVFIKPRCGSSASGVIALRWSPTRIQAYTTIDARVMSGKLALYNSLKILTYRTEEEIQKIINCLAAEDCIIERWIPKALFNGYAFDFRVLVVNGKATHIVPRLSKSPMTNLHLGNKRGELVQLKKHIGLESWEGILHIAEKATNAINGAFYTGVDVMLTKNFSKPYVLEINAFGDLLPHVQFQGRDTYMHELFCMLKNRKMQCSKA